MKPAQRLAFALIVGNLALFALFFALAVYRYSASDIIPVFASRWELSTAGLDFLRWIPPLQFLVAVLAVSTLRGEIEGLVAKVAVPAVVISAIFAGAALVMEPILERQVETSLATSRRFTLAMDGLKTALQTGNPVVARRDYDLLFAIAPKDVRLVELAKKLSSLETKSARQVADAAAEAAAEQDPAGAKAAWLRAKDFYSKNDWYNAHWQATLALRLDPSLLEAKRLAALAWEEISRATGQTPKDAAEAAFFETKLRGYGLLRSEDYIGAWRVFSDLAKDHGDDNEVRRYLKESLAGVEKTSFFRGEADQAVLEAGFPRLFLRFAGPKDGRAAERILAAGELAFVSGAAYLFDLEYLERRADDSVLLVRSQWGKLMGGRLYLVAAERESPGLAYRPTALEIGPGMSPAQGKATRAPASMEIGLSVDELVNLDAAATSPRALRLLDAWGTLGKAAAYGIDPEPLVIELLRRLGVPFFFFGSAALGILVGLRFRLPAGKEKGRSILALPFAAVAVYIGYGLIEHLDGLASAWSARLLPNLEALALSAALRTVFILAAVILFAGASREEPTDIRDSEG
jgi:hypothetical protein